MGSLTYVADHAAEPNTFLQDDKSEKKKRVIIVAPRELYLF